MVQVKPQAASDKRGARDVPDRIGKYVIINEVGQGSTGRVFLSHDPYYGRDVAIKLYNIENEEDEQKARVTRKMFFNEAQMMGRLQHPNILPIYDAGEENGSYYVVTEHVHGARTLAAYCRPDNLLRIDDVVEIMFKCAKGLHYAHGRGVIHRDIKPSNIMLTLDNDVRVIDFGIALIKDSDVSRIEGIAGSPSYMSPEQVQSADITPRSDIYSLGAVMYELLTGYRPFRANSLSKLLHQIVYATPPPIHTLRDGIPEDLEEVVMTALRKEPENRFANALEFAGALTKLHQKLRSANARVDQQEQFDQLRRLRFFHDFSHAEIWEVLRASEWCNYQTDDEIIREGELDDRFYIIVNGTVSVQSGRRQIGELSEGDCFGETSYVRGARRTATIKANMPVTLVRVSSTLLEQASSACQLRFNKVFLRSLIERLQGVATAT
ncbi:MAG TPA: serine/threonine-protein kinase [Gammaproteobacteria bacterium]|jgi:serine/threonine protein kinase|nr:serine/threonine-protein kinase [Gammaproteobacteria bacterium]